MIALQTAAGLQTVSGIPLFSCWDTIVSRPSRRIACMPAIVMIALQTDAGLQSVPGIPRQLLGPSRPSPRIACCMIVAAAPLIIIIGTMVAGLQGFA
jgi:hypothetical protein